MEYLFIAALIGLGIGLALYVFFCFVNYRIVSKFDPRTSFLVNLIPIWNGYLLIRAAVEKPVLFFWCAFLVPFFLVIIGALADVRVIASLGSLIGAVMTAYVYGRIAQKLGKSFVLFLILAIIPFVNIVVILILAFDSSRPAGVQQAGPYTAYQPVPPQPGMYPQQAPVPPVPTVPHAYPAAMATPPVPPTPPPAPKNAWKQNDSFSDNEGE